MDQHEQHVTRLRLVTNLHGELVQISIQKGRHRVLGMLCSRIR